MRGGVSERDRGKSKVVEPEGNYVVVFVAWAALFLYHRGHRGAAENTEKKKKSPDLKIGHYANPKSQLEALRRAGQSGATK
jgi:hypothetical protein